MILEEIVTAELRVGVLLTIILNLHLPSMTELRFSCMVLELINSSTFSNSNSLSLVLRRLASAGRVSSVLFGL